MSNEEENSDAGTDTLDNGLPASPSQLVFKGRSKSLPGAFTYVSLHELEAVKTIDDLLPMTNRVLVGKIVYYKKVQSDKRKGIYSRTSNSNSNVSYDRTLTIMCLNSPPGLNTAVILLDNNRADVLFGQFTIGRDEPGGFGPGAIVAIPRPNYVTNHFGSQNGIPVLSINSGFKLVNREASKFKLNAIPHDDTTHRLHAFYYPKVKLEVMNFSIAHTQCAGHLCDSVGMKKSDGSWSSVCPCYALKRNLGSVVFDLNLKGTKISSDALYPEDPFFASNFTSRSFTDMFTVSGIQSGVNMQHLEVTGADHEIFTALHALIKEINERHGGFNVLGWKRRGFVRDQAAESGGPGGRGGENEDKVASSLKTVHLTKVEFNCSSSVVKEKLIDVMKVIDEARQY